MSEPRAWAKIDNNGICISVEIATREWVDEWTVSNTGTDRYVATDPQDKGYAGIGYSFDEETGRFIPTNPFGDEAYFDREPWEWRVSGMEPPQDAELEPSPEPEAE